MKIKTLTNKKTIVKNGEEIIDFCEPTYLPRNENLDIINIVRVDENYERRFDLIGLAVYKDTSKVDILCKINEVSDPLDLLDGDMIVIPDLTRANRNYIVPSKEKTDVNISESPYIDNTKKSKIDNNRLNLFKNLSASTKNGSKFNLLPNQLTPGELNINISDNNGLLF